MGKGIDLAKTLSPEHAQAIEDMKDQLIIVLVKRLGGVVIVPPEEIDGTGQDLLEMQFIQEEYYFRFNVRKKS